MTLVFPHLNTQSKMSDISSCYYAYIYTIVLSQNLPLFDVLQHIQVSQIPIFFIFFFLHMVIHNPKLKTFCFYL